MMMVPRGGPHHSNSINGLGCPTGGDLPTDSSIEFSTKSHLAEGAILKTAEDLAVFERATRRPSVVTA